VITRLDLQLRRAPSAYCRVTYRRAANLDEAIERLAATEADYRYSVAWVDALATGRSLGRSVLMLGNDAEPDELPTSQRDRPHALPTRRRRSVPFSAPPWLLNRLAVAAFNTAFYARHRDHEAIVDYGRFFYPLDAVAHWNRLYGRRGFVQYQVLLPLETARAGLIAVLEQVAAWKKASFLTVLKKAGPAAAGPLSYMFPGYTLALDLPNTGDDLRRLTGRLDRLLLDHGGRLYLAKDATMSAETFAAMYPRLDEFRRVKNAVDPHHRFVSSQAHRVGIVEP
jgi:decaprenylphospho-beta-D-ribofuranose 2-oxidase